MEVVLGQFDDADEDKNMEESLFANDQEDDFMENEYDVLEDHLLSSAPVDGAMQPSATHFQPVDKVLSKYVDKIRLDAYEYGEFGVQQKVSLSKRIKDKSDRATIEQVLDPRTRIILFKMLSRNVVAEVNGVISTGKEANVYHATTVCGEHRAIKIYKTSILTFKDRDRYVTGEFRFRRGYCKGNPRKMVATWAEKETRNLTRLSNAGISCPKPHLLRGHVLVMEFIGNDGWPAPLLKDSKDLTNSKYRELYLECILMIRRMFHDCKLVHADLSEYNLLYHKEHLVVIDVSQSVEHDHPRALDFLRKDCTNVNDFFRRKGVPSMNVRELFDFVTDVTINDSNIDKYLEKIMSIAANRSIKEADLNVLLQSNDDEVFKQSYIPRTLDEVKSFERDYDNAKKGSTEGVLYQTITGINTDLSGVRKVPDILQLDDSNSSNDDDMDYSSDGGDENHMAEKPRVISRRNMTKEEKKIHKKMVKEQNRDRRTEKTPKHIKKRREKLARNKHSK
ncbi:serine/threonine-protein kinase RIO1-like [Clavelina lepadiformis]|uniref:serine/threonine-protein kinase RIO1-like n=1 Tax=Clavelina lepadiformis TaxID=159417 RepID=UPI004041A3EF